MRLRITRHPFLQVLLQGCVALLFCFATALTISSIAVTGAEAADFPETATTCTRSPAAAASSTVSLTFKPSTTGARSANLKVTDNAAGSPQQVPLSGIGTTAELTPTSLSFGSVKVGTTSAAKTVTLRNVRTTAITITSIRISGDRPGRLWRNRDVWQFVGGERELHDHREL